MDVKQVSRNLEELRVDVMWLHRETMKIAREPWWKPWALAVGLISLGFVLSRLIH